MKETDAMRQSLSESAKEALRVEMARQDIGTAKLAQQMGVTYLWLHRRLRGNTQMTVGDLERIADALGVPALKILGDRGAAA
jgi:transcriptional regulator with XRE-family HTH domain